MIISLNMSVCHIIFFIDFLKNFRKMYYNPVINGEFSQKAGLPHQLMPCHLSPLKNNSEKYIFYKLVSRLRRNKDVVLANLYFLSLIIFINFPILIIFISIIFYLKSILTKNYLMSHLFI
jgi:hypothetical protein